jgi:hypothetical protein
MRPHDPGGTVERGRVTLAVRDIPDPLRRRDFRSRRPNREIVDDASHALDALKRQLHRVLLV